MAQSSSKNTCSHINRLAKGIIRACNKLRHPASRHSASPSSEQVTGILNRRAQRQVDFERNLREQRRALCASAGERRAHQSKQPEQPQPEEQRAVPTYNPPAIFTEESEMHPPEYQPTFWTDDNNTTTTAVEIKMLKKCLSRMKRPSPEYAGCDYPTEVIRQADIDSLGQWITKLEEKTGYQEDQVSVFASTISSAASTYTLASTQPQAWETALVVTPRSCRGLRPARSSRAARR